MNISRVITVLAASAVVFLSLHVHVLSQQLLSVREVFNKVWDKANSRLMTTPWAGAQQVFETETTILNNVYDSANLMLRVSGGSSGGGHVIQDEGVSLTAQPSLNFIGAGITCVDNVGTTATDCTLVSGGGDFSSNTTTSIDGQLMVFSGTTGKIGRRSSGTGILITNGGVINNITQPTGAVVGTTDTQTLSGKRIDQRVVVLTDAATVTVNGDVTDIGVLNTLSQTTNFANPTGTSVNGQSLLLRVTSAAVQALTWGSEFAGSTTFALPVSTTGSDTVDYYGFRRNSATSKWDYVAGTSKQVRSYKVWMPAARCINATASLLWNAPPTVAPSATCLTGSNTQKAAAAFSDGQNFNLQSVEVLPGDWTGALDAVVKWRATPTTGSVVWQFATVCMADGETQNPAFNTASVVIDAAQSVADSVNTANIDGVTTTGCAAGELMHVRIQRDAAHVSDTMAGSADLLGVEMTIRRAE